MASPAPIVALGELLWDLLPGGRRSGGAPFNFAFHCHQLGHPAVIVSRVGDDDLGRDLCAEVRRLEMSDEYIQTDREHPTGTVKVEVSPDGQPAFSIVDDVAWDYIGWEPRLEGLATSARAVCFGTLAQRKPVSRETIRRFVRQARGRCLVVLDLNLRPTAEDPELIQASLGLADWLKVNEDEAGRVSPNTHVPLVCRTRGADGCDVRAWGQAINIPGIPVRVADTVGAGDAFTAALLTQYLEGKPLADAARFANAYAAVVASKPGGTPRVEPAEVERLL
ncbi:MAG: carbohydrate kinase [Zavarzinella sp.]|nr:carbohydrate kinase [Zavarzinella sp.]